MKAEPLPTFGETLETRLKSRDITYVTLVFEGSTDMSDTVEDYVSAQCRIIDIAMPWRGDDYVNDLQKHEKVEDGIYVEIGENPYDQ